MAHTLGGVELETELAEEALDQEVGVCRLLRRRRVAEWGGRGTAKVVQVGDDAEVQLPQVGDDRAHNLRPG